MPQSQRRTLLGAGLAAVASGLLPSRRAGAQPPGFPSRPFTAVVDAGPGGGHDRFCRAIAPEWQRITGQPVVPDFRPGAGGVLAATRILGAPPDGHTLGVVAVSSLNVSIRFGRPNFGYGSFAYLGAMWNGPVALFTGRDSKWQSLEQVMEAARTQRITASVAALRAMYHIAGVIFNRRFGVDFQFVPYPGGGPSRLAAANGETDLVWTGLYDASANYDVLRCLAIFDRENPIPDVVPAPTIWQIYPDRGLNMSHPTGWCVAKAVKEREPERYAWLVDCYRRAYTSEATREALIRLQFVPASIRYISPEELLVIEQEFLEQLERIEA